MTDATDFASIHSPDELARLLAADGIDTSQWGHENTKSVHDLWTEIAAGESRIRTPPLQRVVLGVVIVLIRHRERILIETRQVFANGMTRCRHIPPSEKMQPGESPVDAARRCLREELGVGCQDIEIVASAHPPRREVRPSQSYPELATVYTFHTIEARVQGLSDSNFITHEYSDEGRTWVMQHDWTWKLPEASMGTLFGF